MYVEYIHSVQMTLYKGCSITGLKVAIYCSSLDS